MSVDELTMFRGRVIGPKLPGLVSDDKPWSDEEGKRGVLIGWPCRNVPEWDVVALGGQASARSCPPLPDVTERDFALVQLQRKRYRKYQRDASRMFGALKKKKKPIKSQVSFLY